MKGARCSGCWRNGDGRSERLLAGVHAWEAHVPRALWRATVLLTGGCGEARELWLPCWTRLAAP